MILLRTIPGIFHRNDLLTHRNIMKLFGRNVPGTFLGHWLNFNLEFYFDSVSVPTKWSTKQETRNQESIKKYSLIVISPDILENISLIEVVVIFYLFYI